MLSPKREQYHRIEFFRVLRELLSFWKKNRESSAKKMCVNKTPFLPTLIPLIFLWFSSLIRAIDRMLAQNKKR